MSRVPGWQCLSLVAASIALVLLACVGVDGAEAQQAKSAYRILHRAPKAIDLPLPGELVTLTVSVANWPDTSRVLSGLVTIDGRLIQVASDESYMNERDFPTFEFQVPAPKTALDYQFFFKVNDANVISSERYSVQRNCAAGMNRDSIEIDPTLPIAERVPAMVRRARQLEVELISYETTITLLDELRQAVSE